MKKISVVVPMYCEEEVANESYNRLTKVLRSIENYDYEIIFVDDGSNDNTLAILKTLVLEDKHAKIVVFSRNFGHQCAVSAGLKYVSGDIAVIIDADLQDPPEVIPDMLKKYEEGYEVIYAKRKKRNGESLFKLLTANIFYRFINLLSEVAIPKDTGDFRLVDKKVVDYINKLPEHNKFLRGLFSWVGFRQTAFEYERQSRFAGTTKYPLKKMIKFASDAIISFSSKPLKLAGQLGLITIFISFCLIIYSLIAYFYELSITPGWTSIMIAVTFFSGIQLISLWIMSEYIARIYDETKDRPSYIISETINIEATPTNN